MEQIELLDSTGNEQVDRLWRGLIGIFETTFPKRVSGYYVTGSHANGTALPTSDVDGAIIFIDDFVDRAEFRQAQQLLQHCRTLAPRQLDCILLRERMVFFYGSRFVKFNSKLLYGTDIRNQIEMRQPDFDARLSIHTPYYTMAALRDNPAILTFPLGYPDPDGEFYGYDHQTIKATDNTQVPSMKAVPVGLGWCATALLLFKARVEVEGKQDCLEKYGVYIGDEWTLLLEEVEIKIRKAWNYLIPRDQGARRELRILCERTLAFENHYLTLYHDFLLEELDPRTKSGWWMPVAYADWYEYSVTEIRQAINDGRVHTKMEKNVEVVWIEHFYRIQALKWLRKFIFPGDDNLKSAIANWVDAGDIYLRQAALAAAQAQETQ